MEKKKIQIKIDDLAIPEIIIDNNEEIEKENDSDKTTIDYSKAIPEIHIPNKK